MKLKPRPASLVLAVNIFILINFNIIGFVHAQDPNYHDPLFKIKLFHQDFKDNICQPFPNADKLGILSNNIGPSQTLSSDWINNFILWQKLQSRNEQLIMNKSNPQNEVKALVATNSVKSREIIYADRQESKNKNANFGDIKIKNHLNDPQDIFQDDYALETFIDDSINKYLDMANNQNHSGSSTEYYRFGNYLNIEVSGITVSAINSVPGGKAVATSDIIIKPVQIVLTPSEVEEKIK